MNRAEINRRYREKKIQEDPEYVKKETIKRQENRVKQRRNRMKTKNKIESEDIETRDELVSSILKLNPEMKYNTILQYVRMSGHIYDLMFKKKFDYKNFSWLKDHRNVIDFINNYYSNLASRRTYISMIYNLIQFFVDFEDLVDVYREYKKIIDDQYDELKDDGKLSQPETNLWVDWDTLLDLTKDIKDSRDNLLIQMYTRIPPRRTKAYSLLKVIRDTKNLNDVPREYNYSVFNKNNELVALVLNQYKTVGKYGVYIIDNIPDSVKKASKKYFEEYNLKMGDPLFFGKKTKRVHYTNIAFSKIIKETFKKYTDKMIGTTVLRHIFISHFFQVNPNPTLRQQKQMSFKLGHSVMQMSGYNRFN